MGLQQIKTEQRAIFLNRFVKEILINISEQERVKQRIDLEKLKQKLTPESSKDIFRQIISAQPSEEKRKQIIYRKTVPKQVMQPILNPAVQKTTQPIQKPIEIKPRPELLPAQLLTPSPAPSTGESGMKKIDPLLKDISVVSIECPGPGKNLLLKRNNQTNIARIVLNQNEITEIVENFSKQARIPIVGGILKAAVGNTVISAVISEFVGSRFIINKITPYSLITK